MSFIDSSILEEVQNFCVAATPEGSSFFLKHGGSASDDQSDND